MNTSTWMSFIRQILTFAGAWIVSKGWTDNGTITTVIGSILTLISLVWSYLTHTTVTVPPAIPPAANNTTGT